MTALDDWRALQRDGERTPADVQAEIFFGTLDRSTVTAATEDRLMHLTAAEIALIRPTRRRGAA